MRAGRRISVDFKLGDASHNGLICCATLDEAGAVLSFSDQMDKSRLALAKADGAVVDEVVFAVSGSVSQRVLDDVAALNSRIMLEAPGRFTQPPVRVVVALGGGF